MSEHDNGWDFAKRLSDALLKVRPLGGSELFVKRNNQYYADPAYCGAAIEEAHKDYHSAMMENVRLQRRVTALEMVIREEVDPDLCGCDANRMLAEGIHTLDEAAQALRVSRRWLEYWLAAHPVDAAGSPFYVPMGRRKTFEQNDVTRIRACIREEERCRLKSIGVVGSGIIAAQLGRLAADSASAALAKPKAKTSRRVTLPKSRRNTGTVISMDRAQS
jgi:hypothetical protein